MITCSAPRDSVAEHPASLNGPVRYFSPLGECCGVFCSLPAFPIVTVPAVISAIGSVPAIVIISVPAASVVIFVYSLVYWAGVIITAIVGAPFSDSLPSIIISPLVIIAISVVIAVGWSPFIVVTPSPPIVFESRFPHSVLLVVWRKGAVLSVALGNSRTLPVAGW